MARDLNRSIKIFIDSSNALKGTKDLEERMAKLRQSLQDLDAQGKKGSAEYRKTEKELQNLAATYGTYQEKLKETERILKNLSGATEKELYAVRKTLSDALKNAIRGSTEYNAILQNLSAVERELATAVEARTSWMGRSGTVMSRMADGFNKYFGLATSFIAGITGISFAFRKLAEDVAKMDDVYADVMKTTGSTREEVLELNEAFKKMDTRTSREELNNLARDAGKLGLSGKKDILDFVEAGNQINVALGEDLGEGAIKNIGKITEVFKNSTKELESMDMKGRMLAVGSSINELGQSSTASEAYLVDFTQRLGGVAAQAKISVQDILGYASALDQSGQAVEMSATALQKFIMSLMGDPAKFAKIAGLEVKAFNKLLKEDTNEAIITVLSALSEKGGFQQLIPVFKDMGLDGARAVGVLSALATNIDKVQTAQGISNKAFTEGTSLTNEYNVKNNNLQATLEKQRKAFSDAALELGERLNPALLTSTKWTTYMIKALPVVIDLFMAYGKYILATAISVGTYIIAVKSITLFTQQWTIVTTIHYRLLQAQNALMIVLRGTLYALQVAYYTLTGQVAKARGAMLAFAAVTGITNPLVIFTAVIAALAAGIYFLTRKTTEQITAAKALANINDSVARSIAKEKTELDLLLGVARNEKISKDERLKAIKRLNEISPQYLGNLTLENINTQQATKAVEAYTAAMLNNAKAKAIQTKIEEGELKKLDNIAKKKETEAEKENLGWAARFSIMGDAIDKTIASYDKENAVIDEQIQMYAGMYDKTFQMQTQHTQKSLFERKNELAGNRKYLDELEQSFADTHERMNKKKLSQTGGWDASSTKSEQWADEKELKAYNEKINAQRQLVAEQTKGVVMDEKTLEFQRMSQKQLQEYIATGKEYGSVASDIYKNKFSEDPVATGGSGGGGSSSGTQAEQQKNALDLLLEELETKHQQRLFTIKQQYRDGTITSESEYNTKLFAQDQAYNILREQTLVEYEKKVSDKALKSDINKQIADIQNQRIDQEIKFREKLEKILLDSDPEAREKKEYENRLRDAGVFGESLESLNLDIATAATESEKSALEQKHQVLELLQQQHEDNMVKIRKDAEAKRKAASEEEFQAEFAEKKAQLEQDLANEEQDVALKNGMGALSPEAAFDAEVALQRKRIDLINEEIAARNECGLTISKQLKDQRKEELALTNLYTKEYQRRTQQFAQYGEALGSSLGSAIANQEGILAAFGNTAIDILFDVLSQIVTAEIAKVAAVGIGAIAQTTAKEVASKSFAGIGTAAILTGVITAAMATAKSALKGLISKGKGSVGGSSSSSVTTGERVTKQRAAGKYDVIGADDGKLYRDVPYTGVATTGIVSKPTLMGERGAELVVSHPDFMALQKHINYPLIVQAIHDVRGGKVHQRAAGKYDKVEDLPSNSSIPQSNPAQDKVLSELLSVLAELRDKDFDINYYKFENAKKIVEKSRNGASKR